VARKIYIDNNPILNPPLEISQKGIQAIRNYFRQSEIAGEDELYEAKLIILGESGAGKTTLARKILDSNYRLHEDQSSTKGVDVIYWSFMLKDGHTFRVNIWDFGGQEIYHATHKFFLTKRSLYVLVSDVRREDTDFYYWLNVIQLLGGKSPVLIIKNEKFDQSREIDERQLHTWFSNLKETIDTNLATNRGLPKLVSMIKNHISTLDHVGQKLPKTWIRVRLALEENPDNYISLERYLDICDEHGFTSREDKLQLSGFLHDLGACLHFQEDPVLKHIIILKPKWGTDAVYRVLDAQSVMNNKGCFTRKDLSKIWNDPEYASKQDELLQLMMKFRLCYKIPYSEDTYIAPQLLSIYKPNYEDTWDSNNNLQLRYVYEFMPKGILSQFIVLMHDRIENQDLVWRHGVVVEQNETRAEVIEYYNKREIHVRVSGKQKKDLLIRIDERLDEIHKSYTNLKCKKLIPCNCSLCKDSSDPEFYPHPVLYKFAEAGRPIQCRSSFEMVNPRRLIDDVLDLTHMAENMGEQRFNLRINSPNTVLIVAVTRTEIQAFLDVFSKSLNKVVDRERIGNKIYYNLGENKGKSIYLVQSEMGSASPGGALITINQAIIDIKPQAVIMGGIAYGLRPEKQQLGDILVSKQLLYYEHLKLDMEKGVIPRGDRITASESLLDRFRSGEIDWNGAKMHFGLLLSGEKLVNDPGLRNWLLKTEPEAIGGEMEGEGLYVAARNAKVDWIIVKGICDWADGKKNDDAQRDAALNAAKFIYHVLTVSG